MTGSVPLPFITLCVLSSVPDAVFLVKAEPPPDVYVFRQQFIFRRRPRSQNRNCTSDGQEELFRPWRASTRHINHRDVKASSNKFVHILKHSTYSNTAV